MECPLARYGTQPFGKLPIVGWLNPPNQSHVAEGGFLFAGLIVVILASIAALFVPAMHAGVSAVAALLFSGFILYDTSRLVRGEEDNYVMAAVNMYLNVLNQSCRSCNCWGSPATTNRPHQGWPTEAAHLLVSRLTEYPHGFCWQSTCSSTMRQIKDTSKF